MIYCVSDIHGEYEAWLKMLDKIKFSATDTMYVLGDTVDRGPKPLTLLRDILSRPNVVALAGNHELSACMLLKYLIWGGRSEDMDERIMLDILLWQHDGGASTLAEFREMDVTERTNIVAELSQLELYAEVSAGGRDFVLVHAGLGNGRDFDPDKPLEDYDIEDLVLSKTDLLREYYHDKYLVTGHTPTRLVLEALNKEGRLVPPELPAPGKDGILTACNNIMIDCGCVFGGLLGCICLDTLEMFYV